MKRYLVFNYGGYYPGGGLNDLALATDDWSAVEVVVEEHRRGTMWADYLDVLDASTGQVVVSLHRRENWLRGNAVEVVDQLERTAAEFREKQQ